MKAKDTQRLAERKARIDDRLDGGRQWETLRPVVESTNLHYEDAGRVWVSAADTLLCPLRGTSPHPSRSVRRMPARAATETGPGPSRG